MTPEEWLQGNAFICPHGLGRFSNQQCEENRRKAQENIISYQSAGNLTPCETCTTGNKKIVIQYPIKENKKAIDIERNETVYNGLQNQIKELIKVGKKKIRKCKKCGKEKPHHGKGYCASCYGKEVRIKKMNFETTTETLFSVKNGIKYKPQFVDTSCSSNKVQFSKKDIQIIEAPGLKFEIIIDFDSCNVLFEKLQRRAKQEFRTIENQILWELQKNLQE